MAFESIVNLSEIEGSNRIDAEYYQPSYMILERGLLKTSSCKLWKDIGGKFIAGPFGSSFKVENYTKNGLCRYIRGKDVKEFFLFENDNVYIPKNDFERLHKYSLKEGDILISVVGTLGNTAIIDKYVKNAIFSCKSTLFRTKTVNPYYLIAYLNSPTAKTLLKRKVRGTVQTGLNIDDLRSLPIFIPNKKIQKNIAKIVLDSKEHYTLSKSLYLQAESLFMEELELKDFKLKNELYYTSNFSNVFKAKRLDAEFFYPVYETMFESLSSKFVLKKLKKLADRNKIKFKPISGDIYKYIEIGDVNVDLGEINYTERKGDLLPANAKIPVNGGELIISKVRPTRGAIGIIPNELSNNVICSSAFSVFNVESPLKEFLYIAIRSIIGKLQMGRPTTGTSYPTIRDLDVEQIKIPVLNVEIQKKIASLIQQSHKSRKKANDLLEEAKRKVEDAIEHEIKNHE